MAKPPVTLLVELYYVVSAAKNTTTGRRRRWRTEGGPHPLRDAQIVYEERKRRLRHDDLDVEMVRVEVPMERVG